MDSYGSSLNRSQSLASGLEKLSPVWNRTAHSRSSSTVSSRHSRQQDWEVIDDPHAEMQTVGRVQGSLDVSLAVMSINKKSNRIDLDAGDILYHMKAKSHELFYIWVTKLQAHRLFRKNNVVNVHSGFIQCLSGKQRNGIMATQTSAGVKEVTGASAVLPSANTALNCKVSAWLQQSHGSDTCVQELNKCHLNLSELTSLIQRLQALEVGPALINGDLQRIISIQNLSLEKPKKPKLGKVWGHSRTLSTVEALGMLSSSHLSSSAHLGASVPSIPDYIYSQLSPPNAPSAESKKIQEDICSTSLKVLASLKSVHEALSQERQKLQEVLESNNTSAEVKSILLLSSGMFWNISFFIFFLPHQPALHGPPSVADSAAEYFDASDDLMSSEVSEESGLSDGSTTNSEPEEGHASATRKYRDSISKTPNTIAPKNTGRRTTLPAHCPDNSHVGLMAILYNNIGKDLARVSMPAALNEPVNLLQRLCEELEYSELLDTASNTPDPYQRMVYIAAFAISGYSSATFRNRYKPFNPILGETFECIREDRGFKYISEQVCHHPPISACHAESEKFSFWQDQRWKNKFWGKSLEILPTGMVNVALPRYGDHYEWNKVVTCIHNVLSQQRYLEHYGEVTIQNLTNNVCTCKITFVKSRYWGSDSNKNEVQGVVLDQSGSIIHQFGGLWHEGIFCDTLPTPKCVWKPNPQPKDYLLYYGFSTFAIELNELPPDLQPLLPPTDSRLRPDQRLLEEGKVEEADKKKDNIEEIQRERRKALSKRGQEHVPRFFRKAKDSCGREVWITNDTYWNVRENPGFANMENTVLW
ncbi:oxysterol-binding protein-related protein 7 isoform X4 [Cynoglossus semilaevis]|uniref:oxysterol-binding protein-related protein 7 isoform X4 n=1 Tax=Cynoglossus semilaevis TaxID=244447 RepID=UPI0007DCB2CF|nr:oxysterol-binding protein-related protein 7 isoform X4 [Cynoglossus semilaevis]